jgi:molybdenum cofactor biosynthesis protein B
MSESVAAHRADAAGSLHLAVVTISDTRTVETDTSGQLIVTLSEDAGHVIRERQIVPDEPQIIRSLLQAYRDREDIHAALLTGGTGISPRDQTYETVSALLTKPLPGYGELFRMLSYEQIGPACILSRAIGGLSGTLVILTMPGSRAAVQLAMQKIILPELPHLVREARKGL